MLALVVSTIAFFVATYFLRRYFDDMGIDKTASRSLVIFVLALGIAYLVGAAADWAGHFFS